MAHVNQPPANAAFLKAESQVFASYSVEPQTRELRLDIPRLTVRAVESGTGEPTLFLHGFGLTTAHWAPLLARLPSLHSIAIDMPGHGASDGVDYRGLNLRDWFKDMLTGCLDRLGLDSAHIVGHSQGAMIGMWLALDAPERVRSLIAIGTPAVAFGARLGSLKFLARPVIGPLMLSMPKPASIYRSILERTMGRHALDLHPELVRTTYLATHRTDHGRTISTYLREMFIGADAEPRRYVLSDAELARIGQPVLVIWGQDDNDFQPIAEAKSRVSHMLNARFDVVPGGHEPWLDDLEACLEPVSAFLLN
jgi:Predicted hydrolases or acyltransferases (alpha/beta hydrolase superfamily)